jgi:ABC-type cobalamin/Fe3+-siderophores transport system ATPase subunit
VFCCTCEISHRARCHGTVQLMGPSGSGKTSVLNALASHTPVTKGMTLSGTLRINGSRPEASGVRIGYVQQEDLFYSQMTVQETLDMVAALRLPRKMSQQERDVAVDDVINRLNLAKVRGTIVGDKKTRGVSGGERKRLSIACELLSKPSLLFLDEPTSGLDAFQALKVCRHITCIMRAPSHYVQRQTFLHLTCRSLKLSSSSLMMATPSSHPSTSRARACSSSSTISSSYPKANLSTRGLLRRPVTTFQCSDMSVPLITTLQSSSLT